MNNENGQQKSTFSIPHSYVILFLVILFVSFLTYIIPAGELARYTDPETGTTLVDPNSFTYIESSPISFFGIFQALIQGMEQASNIIFFVLFIGASFSMIQATGAIEAGISKLVTLLEGKEKIVIPIVAFIFSLAGAMLGTAEELLPFYPIIISLALALGYDRIVGTSLVLLGAGAGFAGGFLNPFTVGIAQQVSGLPLFSGMGLRLILYVVILTVTIIYIMRYAAKIQKDPSQSVLFDAKEEYQEEQEQNTKNIEFTTRHKFVLLTFVVGLLYVVYGVIQLDFYIQELSASFLIIGILSGLIGNLGVNGVAEAFVDGAKDMVYGALIVGIATSVLVIMENSSIIDTVIYNLSLMLEGFSTVVSGVGMFFVQGILEFFVPSGSGQAAVSMPIMAPLADVLGMTQQTSVLAFQLGDSLLNVISPTSGYFMAALAIGGITWDKWIKWFWPLFILWVLIAIVFMVIAVLIGYGPF